MGLCAVLLGIRLPQAIQEEVFMVGQGPLHAMEMGVMVAHPVLAAVLPQPQQQQTMLAAMVPLVSL